MKKSDKKQIVRCSGGSSDCAVGCGCEHVGEHDQVDCGTWDTCKKIKKKVRCVRVKKDKKIYREILSTESGGYHSVILNFKCGHWTSVPLDDTKRQLHWKKARCPECEKEFAGPIKPVKKDKSSLDNWEKKRKKFLDRVKKNKTPKKRVTIDSETFEAGVEMIPLLKELAKAGLKTTQHCCGHGKDEEGSAYLSIALEPDMDVCVRYDSRPRLVIRWNPNKGK